MATSDEIGAGDITRLRDETTEETLTRVDGVLVRFAEIYAGKGWPAARERVEQGRRELQAHADEHPWSYANGNIRIMGAKVHGGAFALELQRDFERIGKQALSEADALGGDILAEAITSIPDPKPPSTAATGTPFLLALLLALAAAAGAKVSR